MTSATTPPMTLKAWPTIPPNGRAGASTVWNLEPLGSTGGLPGALRERLSSTNDSSADTVAKKPNTSNAQDPTDIGHQYLQVRPWAPGATSTSTCQNVHQLPP